MSTPPLRVGDLSIHAVWDGRMTLPEPAGVPARDSPEFGPHSRYITADSKFLVDLGAFLIRTAEQVVLVDAGLGPGAIDGVGVHRPAGTPEDVEAYVEMFRRRGVGEAELAERARSLHRQSVTYGSLPTNLASLGVGRAEVTDVVLTHLHPDHVGWVSQGGESFFGNARIWVHSADADWMLGGEPPDETGMTVLMGTPPTPERLAPVREQIQPWTDDVHVAPGILLRHLPGHTPGNAIAVVSSGDDTACLLGDTFHCPLELEDPTFHIRGDVDFEQAKLQKDVVRKQIEAGDIAVASPHFPDLAFGRIFLDHDRHRFSWVN